MDEIQENDEIKVLVMDVDWILTDGVIYLDNGRQKMKMFNVKVGYAIKHILTQMEIISIIIIGKNSKIVQRRCDELRITWIAQGES